MGAPADDVMYAKTQFPVKNRTTSKTDTQSPEFALFSLK